MRIRIEAPHFVAGCADGVCAPIIKYMEHWPIERIASYCKAKGWLLQTDHPTRELKVGLPSYRSESLENKVGAKNMGNDYSNIFGTVAKAKSMGGGGYAERLGLGTHRVALKSYKVKESTKGNGQFLEAEFVIIASNTHKVGETRGWVWFINASGQWAAAYEQDRAKKFLEAVGACVGDDSDVGVIGGNLAGPNQAGKGLMLDVTISPQTGKNAGKTNAKGEPYTNIYWKPIEQSLEDLARQREELEAMEAAPVVETPAPEPVRAAAPVTPPVKTGLGLFGRKTQ